MGRYGADLTVFTAILVLQVRAKAAARRGCAGATCELHAAGEGCLLPGRATAGARCPLALPSERRLTTTGKPPNHHLYLDRCCLDIVCLFLVYFGTRCPPPPQVAKVVNLDPLACKPPGDALLRSGNCSSLGFGVAVGHDPIFKLISLWKKDPGPPPTNYSCARASTSF